MGTNYYVHVNECSCCGRFDRLHFGKSASMVQAFIQYDTDVIYGGDDWRRETVLPFEIRSLADWERYLASVPHSCWNEYRVPMTTSELFALFRSTPAKGRGSQHAWEYNHDTGYGTRSWLDGEGFTVSPGAWS